MLTIRPMEEQDLDAVAAIEVELFSQPWSKKGFLSSLAQKDTLYLTALLDGRVAGYCGLLKSFDEADITNVAVDRTAQGQGVASAMLRELLRLGEEWGIENFTLEVRISNASALHLYEKLGFVREGIRKRFYELPTEDAVIMWKRKPMV